MPFPTFKKKDEIPDAFRGEYEERDGEWHPKIPDTSKLETTLATVRSEKREADKAAKEASDRAGDLQRQLDAAKLAGGDVEKKTAELLANWNKETERLVGVERTEKEKALGELRTIKLDDQLKSEFLKAGGRPERAEKALNDTKRHFDLVDGQIVKKNEKGEVTTEKAGDFYSKTYKGEVPEFYTGTRASGGGASGGTGTTPATGDASLAERVLKDPASVLRDAYRKDAA